MSTQTILKCILLVTIAALGFGVMAAVQSFAARSASEVKTDGTTTTCGDAKTRPTSGSTVTLDAFLAITASCTAAIVEMRTFVENVSTKSNSSIAATDCVTAVTTGADTLYSSGIAQSGWESQLSTMNSSKLRLMELRRLVL